MAPRGDVLPVRTLWVSGWLNARGHTRTAGGDRITAGTFLQTDVPGCTATRREPRAPARPAPATRTPQAPRGQACWLRKQPHPRWPRELPPLRGRSRVTTRGTGSDAASGPAHPQTTCVDGSSDLPRSPRPTRLGRRLPFSVPTPLRGGWWGTTSVWGVAGSGGPGRAGVAARCRRPAPAPMAARVAASPGPAPDRPYGHIAGRVSGFVSST